jgi:hypothetical protein
MRTLVASFSAQELAGRGTDLMPPIGAQSHRVATLMISHKRKRWRPQPEALLGDKGYDTDSFINSLEVRAIKAATRYEKTARNFPWRAASGLRTRLAQMTRGPRIANPSKGSGGNWCSNEL